MPFGDWEDFDACVTDMMQEQDYDENTAERVCGALQERLKEAEEDAKEFQQIIQEEMEAEEGNVNDLLDSIENAGSVISDGVLEMVSAVSNPAQPSEWVMMKSENSNYDWKSTSPLLLDNNDSKEDDGEDLRVGVAPALVPNEVDKDGDVVPATSIRKMAHSFLKEDGGIDEEHNLIEGKGEVVESWLLKEDRSFEMPDGEEKEYPAGTWMLGIEFVPETWEKIQSGELSGLSIYGKSQHIELKSEDGGDGELYNCECLDCGYTLKTDEHCKNLSCPECGGDMRREERPGDGEKVQSIKPISDKSNNNDDTMSEEDMKQIKEQLNKQEEKYEELKSKMSEISETLTDIKDTSEESEEVNEEEKQEIENMTDAIDWLENNAPEELVDMVVDAVRSAEDMEESEDNDDEGKDEEDTASDEDVEPEEKSADPVEKGHDGEGVRKSRQETSKQSKGIDFKEVYDKRTGGES